MTRSNLGQMLKALGAREKDGCYCFDEDEQISVVAAAGAGLLGVERVCEVVLHDVYLHAKARDEEVVVAFERLVAFRKSNVERSTSGAGF